MNAPLQRLVRVYVTQDDIDTPLDEPWHISSDCVIARAVRRTFGTPHVDVFGWSAEPHTWRVRVAGAEMMLPKRAARAAMAWQDDGRVEPFSFLLRLSPGLRPDLRAVALWTMRKPPLLKLCEVQP